MIANSCKFDPETGAPLSEDKYYPTGTAVEEYQTGVRVPVEHPDSAWKPSREGALTNGEVRSSRQGLLGYFERVLRKYCSDPSPKWDIAAANALRYLKTDDQHSFTADCFVWYALAERITRKHDFFTGWMLHFAVPRCPHCLSECKFKGGVYYQEAVCASQPGPTIIPEELEEQGYRPGHGNVDEAIRKKIIEVYNAAFDETIEEITFR